MISNRRLGRIALTLFLAALAAILCMIVQGCAPSHATVARMDGFNRGVESWDSIDGMPVEYETFIAVRVVITNTMPREYAGAYFPRTKTIVVRGKMLPNGKILPCWPVLSHEFLHALEYQDGGFVDPDTLTKMGY